MKIRLVAIILLLAIAATSISCSSTTANTAMQIPATSTLATVNTAKTLEPTQVVATPAPAVTDTTKTPEPTQQSITEVKLSESILQAGIADSANKTSWGINLSTVSINYRTGVKVSGWLILHNGNDSDRLVTIRYLPTNSIVEDTARGINYLKTPPFIKEEWITVGVRQIRLRPMETKDVGVSLLIPSNVNINLKNWAFYINADGAKVNKTAQEIIVTTDPNETACDLTLKQDLLLGDTRYISRIKSSIDENVQAIKYNKNSKALSITGLTPAIERHLTIEYEYTGMFTQAYNQIWLLTML